MAVISPRSLATAALSSASLVGAPVASFTGSEARAVLPPQARRESVINIPSMVIFRVMAQAIMLSRCIRGSAKGAARTGRGKRDAAGSPGRSRDIYPVAVVGVVFPVEGHLFFLRRCDCQGFVAVRMRCEEIWKTALQGRATWMLPALRVRPGPVLAVSGGWSILFPRKRTIRAKRIGALPCTGR
jgi:hypothetical protein